MAEAEAIALGDPAAAAVDPSAAAVQPPVGRKSLLHNIGALMASQVVTWVMSTVVIVLVPRRVGPESIGNYRIATSLWSIAAVVITFGTSTLLTLEVAKSQRHGRVELGPTVGIRLSMWLASWVPLMAFVLAVDYPAEVTALVVIVGVGTLITTLGDVPRAALAGLERLDLTAVGDVIVKFVVMVLTIIAVILTDDMKIIALATIIASVFYAGFLFRALHRLVKLDFDWGFHSARDAVRRSSPYFLIAVTRVVYNQIDVVVMSFLVTSVEVGWYGTADSVFSTFLFVPTILMTSLFPVIARTQEENPDAVGTLLQRSFNGLSLVAVPVGLGLFIVADQLAVLLYGDAFDGTGPVLSVMGIVLIFTFFSILLGYYAVGIGRQRFWNIVMLIAIPMTVVLDVLLVPWTSDQFDNGALGGALSYVITEAMMVVVGIWKLAPHLASRATFERAWKSLAAGAVMIAVCWPLRDVFVGITIVVGAITFVIVFLLLRPLDDDEKKMIRRFRRKLPGPLAGRS